MSASVGRERRLGLVMHNGCEHMSGYSHLVFIAPCFGNVLRFFTHKVLQITMAPFITMAIDPCFTSPVRAQGW